jgi:hypothetical protein
VKVLRRFVLDSSFEKIENISSRRRVRVFYEVRDEFFGASDRLSSAL